MENKIKVPLNTADKSVSDFDRRNVERILNHQSIIMIIQKAKISMNFSLLQYH